MHERINNNLFILKNSNSVDFYQSHMMVDKNSTLCRIDSFGYKCGRWQTH